jgi:hypothetical protein
LRDAVPPPYWGMYTKKSQISHSFCESPVPYRMKWTRIKGFSSNKGHC